MNKTFKELKKGDKIYAVVTDLPKLKVTTLVIKHIEERYPGVYDFTVSCTENIDSISKSMIYSPGYEKDKCHPSGCRYICWHTNEEAARKTIKETIQERIKKHEETIKASKKALKNYKKILENINNNVI